MLFSQKLESLCKDNGISITKLAETLGYSSSAGNTWRRSKGLPRNSTLKKMADYFGMTTDELLEGVGVEMPVDYESVDTSAFNQQIWQTILARNNYNEHKAIDAYLNFEKAQMQDAMNGNVIHDNHGVIGNASAPVNISNDGATLSAQETELLNAFRKLGVMEQAQILVKTAELLRESKKS